MLRLMLSSFVAVACLGAHGVPAAAQQITDDQVDRAVERAAAYLLKMQNDDGSWPPHKDSEPANTVMCMLGLAYAEHDPRGEAMTKGTRALIDYDLTSQGRESYLTAFRLQALAKLLNKVDREPRELVWQQIKTDAERIIRGQTADGGWAYSLSPGGTTFADFSNVQVCMLGLGEAIRVGLELPKEPLARAQMLYIQHQWPDGGWHYGRKVHDDWPWTTDQALPTYGSMTAAGVASLYITRDYLYRGMGCPCRGGRSSYRPNKVDEAIEHGLDWLGERYTAAKNPKSTHFREYWLYSCERVGLASGIKYFGPHNWYTEGARFFLDSQRGDGGWGHRVEDGKWNASAPQTAWAILFLVKGRAPILMNKLRFDGHWNLHPHDLKHLAKYVGGLKEQDFAWQVIDLAAPVDEWHDAPILYISAESITDLTDEQRQKLRTFTDTGGTILFEASCGNTTVRRWWENLVEQVWPEYELRRVDRQHPVWTAEAKIVRQMRGLQEMSDGVRSFIFYSPVDLSCAWNTYAINQRADVFQLGANLYAYATDRAKIRSRLSRFTQGVRSQDALRALGITEEKTLDLVRMKHGGDWNVTARYGVLDQLARRLSDVTPLTVKVHEPAWPNDEDLPSGTALYLTGRGGITLSAEQLAALKQRVSGGGLIFADAALGDERFDKAFRAMVGQLGWALRPLGEDHPLVRGRTAGGAGHALIGALDFTPTAVEQARGPLRLELWGLYAGDKLVGIYSPRDVMLGQAGIRAWGTVGYEQPTAQKIAENVILHAAYAVGNDTGE